MRMDGTRKIAVVNFMIYNQITSRLSRQSAHGHAEQARVKVSFLANTLHEYVLRYFTVLVLGYGGTNWVLTVRYLRQVVAEH